MHPHKILGLVVFFLLALVFTLLAADAPFAMETALAQTDPENHPPVAVASINEDPVELWTCMTIHFSSAGSYDIDGEGRISFTWDFDDGSDPSTLANPTHVYKEPGVYNVILTVLDSKNVMDTYSMTLRVQLDYGDTDIVIKALKPTSEKTFKDPGPPQYAQVAVKRDGWVAYLCDLKKGDKMLVDISILGDRPVDIYLFNHTDFLTYRNEPRIGNLSSETEGHQQGVDHGFFYLFRAPKNDRYYVVIDNKDWPPGTDTEGPVIYTIKIDPWWEMDPGRDGPWDIMSAMVGPIVGMSIVLIAMLAVIVLFRDKNDR